MPPDPKPSPRLMDSYAIGRKLASDTQCRLCTTRASEGHHILLRSQGGDDVEDNIMPLCSVCHRAYHAGMEGPLGLTQAEQSYLFAKLGKLAGQAYMDKRRLEAAT